MRLTPKAQAERYAKMVERLSERVDEMLTPRSIASRVYPHLKTEPEPDQPKRSPIQGWSHLKTEK